MNARGMMFDSYAWRLEVAVWVANRWREDDEVRCKPRLLMAARAWDGENAEQYKVLGFVEYDVGGSTEGPASWLVYHYPQDAEGLWEHQDETKHGFRHVLSAGETRYPRPPAKDALRYLLELTAQEIPRPEHGALVTTAEVFLPALQKMTDAYVRRHRRP